jgi:hypothetical protein
MTTHRFHVKYPLTREGDMLRAILVIAAISAAMGAIPASAQGGGCQQWCAQNRCAGGMGYAAGGGACMSKCVPACQAKVKARK